MLKGIRGLTVLVFVVYFVSVIAGPSYGWKGASNGVEYDIYMHQWRGNAVTVMEMSRLYHLNIIAKNKGVPVSDLKIELPEGFKLNSTMIKDIKFPEKNWNHVFDIETPSIAGDYSLKFNGKDEKGDNVDFSVNIKVTDRESYEYYPDELRNLNMYLGLFVVMYAVIRILGILK